MKANTTRFGEIDVDNTRILNFIQPIIGYNDYSKYTLLEHNGNDMFYWLQSLEDPELAFPVSIPSRFDIDYSFEIDDATVEKLEIKDVSDILIYNIVAIPVNEPKKATINLLGPVIINAKNNKALQYIISNSDYTSRYPLFDKEQQK